MKRKTVENVIWLAVVLCLLPAPLRAQVDAIAEKERPADIIDVNRYIPNLVIDIRYYSDYNFVGRPIRGYERPKCLLSRRAAKALKTVQEAAAKEGYRLKIFDCYRPQMAVDDFVAWASNPQDIAMKSVFYPFVEKSALFEKGYIAAQSGHSRASTVDLSLVDNEGTEINMGYPYDFFDAFSHTDNPDIEEDAFSNRQYLKNLMQSHGFVNLPEEWWHYTLRDEPYPKTYFDFPVN